MDENSGHYVIASSRPPNADLWNAARSCQLVQCRPYPTTFMEWFLIILFYFRTLNLVKIDILLRKWVFNLDTSAIVYVCCSQTTISQTSCVTPLHL